MAKKKPVNMDQKAGNAGDRMKHALSLEVLSRTSSWDQVTYAETHAGAGEYLQKKQTTPPHIRDLRDIVLWQIVHQSSKASRSQMLAGSTYLELLKNWWFDTGNHGKYPGSAKQAAIYLNASSENRSFELRLTEKAGDAFKRLKKAVADFPGEARKRSFYDERGWLTKPDNLVLVVDPFRCVESFEMHDATDIENGDIDHGVIKELLDLCAKKQAAVLHFWWSKRSQPGGSEMDKLVTESIKRPVECFRNGQMAILYDRSANFKISTIMQAYWSALVMVQESSTTFRGKISGSNRG